MDPVLPPVWTDEVLEKDRSLAVAQFRHQRITEPLEAYLEQFDRYQGIMENLLESTVDLTRVEQQALQILTKPEYLIAFRYLPGPPISEDDLKILADAKLSPKALREDKEMISRVLSVVRDGLDRRRFPWLSDDREPSEAERHAAILASAVLLAKSTLETGRRSTSKTEQEGMVRDALRSYGLLPVPSRTVSTMADAPGLGEFCGESMLATRKADFLVRLYDGRVMALECKVSNSATNSVKRLNNDAAIKAETWLKELGVVHVVPAAVLSGVYKLHNLQNAQKRGLTIFWAHDLEQLILWIHSTKKPGR